MFSGFGFGANLIMQPPQNQIIPKELPEGLGLSGQGGSLASSGDKAKNYNQVINRRREQNTLLGPVQPGSQLL